MSAIISANCSQLAQSRGIVTSLATVVAPCSAAHCPAMHLDDLPSRQADQVWDDGITIRRIDLTFLHGSCDVDSPRKVSVHVVRRLSSPFETMPHRVAEA